MPRRIFVSIDIPDETKNILESYLADFYKDNLARVSSRRQWHITVIFCGNMEEDFLQKLKEKAKQVAESTKSFEMKPDKIVFAPPGRHPKMVWLSIKNSQGFLNLVRELASFSEENPHPSPHITLVRFQDRHFANLKPYLPIEGVDVSQEIPPIKVNAINIMESHLNSHEAEHSLVEKYNLL